MNEIITNLLVNFKQFGLPVIAVIVMVQNIGIPDGAALAVIASGAFAFLGEFNFFILFAIVFVSSVAGDSAGYLLWRLSGNFLLERFPLLERKLEPKLKKASMYYKRFGKTAIFITRFPPMSVFGTFINATAGISEVRFIEFAPLAVAGEFLCTAIYLGLGYWFGDAWETIYTLLTEFGELILLVAALLAVSYVCFTAVRGRRKS